MKIGELAAQGDVIIEKISSDHIHSGKPVDADPDGAVVLARGEVTGHRHAFYTQVAMFHDESLARDMDQSLYIGHIHVPAGGADLKHEEHDTINLDKGTYRIRRQRESSATDVRIVAD